MRSFEQIENFWADVQQWHQDDFGIEINEVDFTDALRKVLLKRLEAFVHRRIGHLPDKDFMTLLQVFRKRYAKKEKAKA